VRVTPRAGRDQVDGVGPNGELLVRVSAAPADGAANTAVLRIIAAACAVAPSRLQLVRGATARTKQVAVDDIDPQALARLWPGLLTRGR
jgi:uncharacterized protein YggU (UPF0235/DUF167 family)